MSRKLVRQIAVACAALRIFVTAVAGPTLIIALAMAHAIARPGGKLYAHRFGRAGVRLAITHRAVAVGNGDVALATRGALVVAAARVADLGGASSLEGKGKQESQ